MFIRDPPDAHTPTRLLSFLFKFHLKTVNLQLSSEAVFCLRLKVLLGLIIDRFSRPAAMTRIAPAVAVILASSLTIWTDAESSILCAWTKVMPTEEVHYSFLRRDPRQASPSLRLYHSSWSGERALLSCAWSGDAAVIQNYLSVCRERTHEFSDHQSESLDVNSLFEGEDLCASVASPEIGGVRTWKRQVRSVHGQTGSERDAYQGQDDGSEGRTHRRVKRGFIVPGTLWCGSGNKAPSYQDLGRLVLYSK